MIHSVLAHVTAALNDYLNVRAPAMKKDRAATTNLVDAAGQLSAEARDRIVLAVANVDENRVYRSLEQYRKRPDGVAERVRPQLKLDVTLLVAANLGDYPESLKMLSHVIAFFHLEHGFSIANQDGDAVRVQFELMSVSFEQQNHLWASLGAKYVPSVLYRVSILDIRDTKTEDERQPVQEIRTGA